MLDLLHFLAIALFSALTVCPLFFWPGCVCCCKVACGNCANTAAPCNYTVVITDLDEHFPFVVCTDCGFYNATYIIPENGLFGCEWHYSIPGAPCTMTGIAVRFDLPGGVTRATVSFDNGPVWRKTYGGVQDCFDINGVDIPLNTSGGNCNAAASTCTLTAS